MHCKLICVELWHKMHSKSSVLMFKESSFEYSLDKNEIYYIVLRLVTSAWSLVFSFDRIKHAAQTTHCLKTSYIFKQTIVPMQIYFIYILLNDVWPCSRFDDGVAFVFPFRPKSWGPWNKSDVLERKHTYFTSWWLKRSKMYRRKRSLFVVKLY